MYLLGVAIENEEGEIRLTVLKSSAGGREYITDMFWRTIKNGVAGRIQPAGRSLGTLSQKLYSPSSSR